MRFIKVKFFDGLGNQLFQYAMARAQMKKNDLLFFDVSSYANDYYGRNFMLDKFLVKGSVLKNNLISKFFVPQSKVNRFISKFNLFGSVDEKGYYFHSNVKSRMRILTTFSGYWQTEKYFKLLRHHLQSEIVPKTIPELPGFVQQDETVAVHIRRTDYLNDSRYDFLGKEYYTKAIEHIKPLVNNPYFVFFSDDMDWCRQNFNVDNSSFCEDLEWQSDYLQLYLMTKCKHHIIANSSFSWWGAWLSANPQQVVIRPARPFKDESLLHANYYPEKWLPVLN